MREPVKKTNKEPRMNQHIRVPEVRLVDESGQLLGAIPTHEALARAKELGLDLVEVAPDARPPVCKILDYKKQRFEERKKKQLARKKQRTLDVKELQFRLMIETHDYQVKMRNAVKFLTEGHKVRIVLRFRGRELSKPDVGQKLIERILADAAQVGKVDFKPKMEGRRMLAILAPIPQKPSAQKKATEPLEESSALTPKDVTSADPALAAPAPNQPSATPSEGKTE